MELKLNTGEVINGTVNEIRQFFKKDKETKPLVKEGIFVIARNNNLEDFLLALINKFDLSKYQNDYSIRIESYDTEKTLIKKLISGMIEII